MKKRMITLMVIMAISSMAYGDGYLDYTVLHTTAMLSHSPGRFCATTVGNKAMFASGNVVDIYDADTGLWSTIMLPQGDGCLAATTVGNKAFFVSGNAVDIYDADTDTWTWSTGALSQARSSLAATTAGNKVLLAGGEYGANFASNLVDIYNADTEMWSTATLSQARYGLCATSVGNKAFFAGGAPSSHSHYFSDVVDIYDADTETWSTAKLSRDRFFMAATTVGNKAIFAGGECLDLISKYLEPSHVVDIYDADTDTWSTATLLHGRYSPAATTVGNLAIIAGGHHLRDWDPNGSHLSTIAEIYDANTGLWSTAPFSQGRQGLCATTVGNMAIFAGGWDGYLTSYNVVDIYTILPTAPPIADADGPYSIYVGDTLTLDASGSTDADDDIVSYMWDLDDVESFETDAGGQAIFDVNYTYLQSLGLLVDHTHNIHVQVTDSQGQSDVASTTLTIVPKPATVVAVDIKPSSCPNPVNVKSRGVLPIAILGSADYDVTTIDPTSIRLAGVASLRSSFEDVATPVSDSNDCNCITDGPDGFLDLTLKFETQRIVEAIGDVNDGDVRVLTLTGVLFDPMAFETPIEGADCILIRGRHKPFNRADINKDGVVNVADFAIIAENWLRSSVVED